MARLFLIRHALSVVDTIIETMHRDPLHQAFRESLKEGLLTETGQAIARELHLKYCLPCNINDAELAPEGIGQIEALGCFLKTLGVQPQKIWCSPLVRTRATLECLNVSYSPITTATVIYDERLIERQRGDEVSRFADIRIYQALNPSEFLRKINCPPLGYTPPGGESLRDVWDRANLALQEIRTELYHGDNLVIAHHGIICAMRNQLERLSESEFLQKLICEKPPNCGALVYITDGDEVKFLRHSW